MPSPLSLQLHHLQQQFFTCCWLWLEWPSSSQCTWAKGGLLLFKTVELESHFLFYWQDELFSADEEQACHREEAEWNWGSLQLKPGQFASRSKEHKTERVWVSSKWSLQIRARRLSTSKSNAESILKKKCFFLKLHKKSVEHFSKSVSNKMASGFSEHLLWVHWSVFQSKQCSITII